MFESLRFRADSLDLIARIDLSRRQLGIGEPPRDGLSFEVDPQRNRQCHGDKQEQNSPGVTDKRMVTDKRLCLCNQANCVRQARPLRGWS